MADKRIILSVLSIIFTIAVAFEPSPLQDFCVADPSSSTEVNGIACMDPKLVGANHFSLSGLHMPPKTPVDGLAVTPVTVAQLPGLNTLGISMARVDYARGDVVPPHYHPRASEILTVLEGNLLVGFVTSNPENKLISKVLQKGDVFVFPMGLVHFQQNVGFANAVSIAFFCSQKPGLVPVAKTIFGSNPAIANDILNKAFQVDKAIIKQIQAKFQEVP